MTHFQVLTGELWWGGLNIDGHVMPFAEGFRRSLHDLRGNMACKRCGQRATLALAVV